MRFLPSILSATLAVALTSTPAFATSIVTEWNDVLLQAVRDTRFGPPQTARAGEAGLSRLYGGIHFSQTNTAGQALGRKIGKKVWAKSLLFFRGKTTPGD